MAVGIGIPIPVLDEEILNRTAVTDEDIFAQVVDYSENYPNCVPGSLGEVSYAQLKSGSISVNGKKVPTAGLSSYARAREVANIVKDWIADGSFLLSEPVAPIPSVDSGIKFKFLQERPIFNNARVAVD